MVGPCMRIDVDVKEGSGLLCTLAQVKDAMTVAMRRAVLQPMTNMLPMIRRLPAYQADLAYFLG